MEVLQSSSHVTDGVCAVTRAEIVKSQNAVKYRRDNSSNEALILVYFIRCALFHWIYISCLLHTICSVQQMRRQRGSAKHTPTFSRCRIFSSLMLSLALSLSLWLCLCVLFSTGEIALVNSFVCSMKVFVCGVGGENAFSHTHIGDALSICSRYAGRGCRFRDDVSTIYPS